MICDDENSNSKSITADANEHFLSDKVVLVSQFSYRDDQPLPNFNSLAVNVRIPDQMTMNNNLNQDESYTLNDK